MSVPRAERTGKMFKIGRTVSAANPCMQPVSKVIREIGEKANIVVNRQPVKFASAHDFRRSFGTRWPQRVMPPVLQAMMRGADLTTTMNYFAVQDGQRAAAHIYSAFASITFSNTSPSQGKGVDSPSAENTDVRTSSGDKPSKEVEPPRSMPSARCEDSRFPVAFRLPEKCLATKIEKLRTNATRQQILQH